MDGIVKIIRRRIEKDSIIATIYNNDIGNKNSKRLTAIEKTHQLIIKRRK